MRQLACVTLFLSSLLFCDAIFAEDARVIWVDASCSYFIADLKNEFGIYQWRSGSTPNEGDVMSGPLYTTGMLNVTNTTRNEANSVILVAVSPTLKSLVNSSPVQCKRRYEKQQ